MLFFIFIPIERVVFDTIEEEFKDSIQYICINDEIDCDHDCKRINVQIVFNKIVDKCRPFLDRSTSEMIVLIISWISINVYHSEQKRFGYIN